MATQNKQPQIRVSNSAFAKIVFHRATKSIAAVVGVAILLYVCFAATVLRVVPTTTTGFVPVKNLTFEGGTGNVPHGREILVDVAEQQGTELLDRLQQAFIPNRNAALVRVIAGSTGSLTWAHPDILSVDGKIVSLPMPAAKEEVKESGVFKDVSPLGDQKYLKGEYAVECISGACETGTVFIVPKDHIIGVPLGSSERE